jgi:hypothetical protein
MSYSPCVGEIFVNALSAVRRTLDLLCTALLQEKTSPSL